MVDDYRFFSFNVFENSMSSLSGTGKSLTALTEALIFASINPQYDRLFIELRVHYMKIASWIRTF